MGLHAVLEAEAVLEVRGGVLVEDLGEGSVNSLLVGDVLRSELHLGSLLAREESLLTLGLGVLGLGLEVLVVELGDVDAGHVQLGGGGDDVGLVHAAQRDAVDVVRASDEQEARLELLHEHHALALEVPREEDQDRAGGDAGADLGGIADDVLALGLLDVVGRVEAGGALALGQLAAVLLLQGPQTAPVVGLRAPLGGSSLNHRVDLLLQFNGGVGPVEQ